MVEKFGTNELRLRFGEVQASQTWDADEMIFAALNGSGYPLPYYEREIFSENPGAYAYSEDVAIAIAAVQSMFEIWRLETETPIEVSLHYKDGSWTAGAAAMPAHVDALTEGAVKSGVNGSGSAHKPGQAIILAGLKTLQALNELVLASEGPKDAPWRMEIVQVNGEGTTQMSVPVSSPEDASLQFLAIQEVDARSADPMQEFSRPRVMTAARKVLWEVDYSGDVYALGDLGRTGALPLYRPAPEDAPETAPTL